LAERAVELDPTARNFSLLASIAQKQKDFSTARAAIREALALDPENQELIKLYESLSKN
jgi:Flp pilus assembly protein TadD